MPDQGRGDFPNVTAIVTAVQDGLYTLGTKHGVLQQMCSQNQIMPCTESFLSVAEVPTDGEELPLRRVARLESNGSGQRFYKCKCTKGCRSARCKCRKNNVKCNSKCHSSLTCAIK